MHLSLDVRRQRTNPLLPNVDYPPLAAGDSRIADSDQQGVIMRTFLLTIFWVTNFGNVIQLLIMVTGGWVLISGAYSFFDLNVDVFITVYVPWFLWLKTLIVELLGELGIWVLTIPILIIAPLKLIAGTIIGLWAYSVAKNMPDRRSST